MSSESYFIAGINGRFGAIFARKLAQAGASVAGLDLQTAPAEPAACGTYFRCSLVDMEEGASRAIAAADHVLLCVPEGAVVAALPRLGRVMRADALLVDIASVKSRIHESFSRLDTGIGYSSIHPMFGPMEDFSGRAVCVVPLRENSRARKFSALLAQWGAQVRLLTAQQHDSAMALVQALPHAALIAFGATLAGSGVSFDTLVGVATPVQKLMLALTARLVSAAPETYWSIQAANPHASRVRDALASQLGSLTEAASDDDAQRFRMTLEAIRKYLGAFEGDLQQLAEGCVAAAGE
jgi:4-amino-4-deoxyprephenate dehydrogenase